MVVVVVVVVYVQLGGLGSQSLRRSNFVHLALKSDI